MSRGVAVGPFGFDGASPAPDEAPPSANASPSSAVLSPFPENLYDRDTVIFDRTAVAAALQKPQYGQLELRK